MIEYLDIHDGPVVPGLEDYEVVYAKEQPQYRPLRALRANTPGQDMFCRWALTPEQRLAIANGADIYLSVQTFGQPLQPVSVMIAAEGDIDPVETAKNLNLSTQEIPGVTA